MGVVAEMNDAGSHRAIAYRHTPSHPVANSQPPMTSVVRHLRDPVQRAVGAVGECAAAVPADHLDVPVVSEPGGESVRGVVGQPNCDLANCS